MHYTNEQKANIERQTRELKRLRSEIEKRGVPVSLVGETAGYHKNLLHTWFGQMKAGKTHSRIYSDESMGRVWAALDRLAPARTTHEVETGAEAPRAPIRSNGEGRHEAGKEALMKLIDSHMQGMSTVQLALLYAHIVGDEG